MNAPQDWDDHGHQGPRFDVGGYDSDNDFIVEAPKQGKKNKNGNANNNKDGKNNVPFEIRYEGYYLEKAAPRNGELASWARAGRRALPVDNAKLARMSRVSKDETREGPTSTFARLTANQQGVITRLIAEKQAAEQNKNAEWVMDCVRRYTEKKWSTREIITKKILLIIKRQDRNAPARTADGKSTSNVAHFQLAEIIDLDDPLPTKKKDAAGKKGGKKANNINKNNFRDDFIADEIIEGPFGGAPDPFVQLGRDQPIVEMPGPHGGGHQQHQAPIPQGAIPVNQPWAPQPFQQHTNFQDSGYGHGGQPPQTHQHPFQPNAEFNGPELYEKRDFPPSVGRESHFQTRTPVQIDDQDEHIRRHSRSRSRSVSRRRTREAEDRRREEEERAEEARRQQRIENRRMQNEIDELNDKLEDFNLARDKVAHWNIRDTSSDESYRDRREKEDFWSDQSRASFSPPSSPNMTEVFPSGSLGRGLHRRKSSAGNREFRGYPDERRRAYNRDGQTIIEPYNSHSRRQHQHQHGHRRHHSDYPPRAQSPGRHMRSRPRLHHANTFADDYPDFPPAQRTLPQHESQDFRPAEFGRGRERGREYEIPRRRNTGNHGHAGMRRQDIWVEDRGGRRYDRVWA